MNYELAKKLKDAGFPQYGEGEKYCEPQWRARKIDFNFVSCDCDHTTDEAYFPTLGELIEACGDEFNCLFKHPEEEWRAGYAVSEVEAGFGFANRTKIGDGSTPEEAVANLWLQLNKK